MSRVHYEGGRRRRAAPPPPPPREKNAVCEALCVKAVSVTDRKMMIKISVVVLSIIVSFVRQNYRHNRPETGAKQWRQIEWWQLASTEVGSTPVARSEGSSSSPRKALKQLRQTLKLLALVVWLASPSCLCSNPLRPLLRGQAGS